MQSWLSGYRTKKLLDEFGDANDLATRAVVECHLGRLGSRRAIPAVAEARNSPDKEVRQKARIAVRELRKAKRHPLIAAAKAGDLELARLLIDGGENVNSGALHLAAESGHRDLVRLLIANGADVNDRDQFGVTPLALAVLGYHTAIVRELIENGADVKAKSTLDRSPLHCAVAQGYEGMAKLLISSGADIGTVDKDGKSPLQLARDGALPGMVRMLVDAETSKGRPSRFDTNSQNGGRDKRKGADDRSKNTATSSPPESGTKERLNPIDMLKDPNKARRLEAAKLLANRPGPATASALIGALGDTEEEVRAEAVKSRGDLGESSAVQALTKVLPKDQNDAVRDAAAR